MNGHLSPATALVMAKAPVAGRVKTRLGATVGMEAAADLAAAALLDTLAECLKAFSGRCRLALSGDLAEGVRAEDVRSAVERWTVVPQRGESLGERLMHAHAEVTGPVVQIGMDTPQVAARHLRMVAAGLAQHDAMLGPALDGGWWVLALRDPKHAAVLQEVVMSTAETFDQTLGALRSAGLQVGVAEMMRDVDDEADAAMVAAAAPHTGFARAWSAYGRRTSRSSAV